MLLLCYTVQSHSQQSDTTFIKQLNSKWLNAIVKKDTASLSSVLASDFTLINPAGKMLTKADNLANVLKPGNKVTAANIDKVEVRLISENVGILSAWTTFIVNKNGKKTTGHTCYQDVYLKRNNTWQAVSAHVTLLGMQ